MACCLEYGVVQWLVPVILTDKTNSATVMGSIPRSCETQELKIGVAYLGCLSRILIFIHPGSRFPDPGSNNNNKRRGGGGEICRLTFFCRHSFHKTSIFLTGTGKNLSQFKKNYCHSFQKYGLRIRDPTKKPFSDPAVTKAPDPGFRSTTLLKM